MHLPTELDQLWYSVNSLSWCYGINCIVGNNQSCVHDNYKPYKTHITISIIIVFFIIVFFIIVVVVIIIVVLVIIIVIVLL